MVELGRPERSITTSKEDTLGRTGFVRRLVDAVINRNTETATGVVVGLTGPWGSGKSSVLNLVAEDIGKRHSKAVVVRFDPWLVSGRNDLITTFISELLGQIRKQPKAAKLLKRSLSTLEKYGKHLLPAADLLTSGIASPAAKTFGAVQARFSSDESIDGLRRQIIEHLIAAHVPIVVLIDELDRVEDSEIRTIAQLVRAVADFPSMSYILAYDAERVAQALGADAPDGLEIVRGRAYLEKIVQLQIPLPVTLDDEVARMVTQELRGLADEIPLPENFDIKERYDELVGIVCGTIIATPRDVGRLIGTYHALAGMLQGEVDWVDLLAYCVLMTKAPEVVSALRRDPGLFTGDTLSRRDVNREIAGSRLTPDARLALALPPGSDSPEIRELMGFLFPKLSEPGLSATRHSDALHERRPLLTTLRLGLLPGSYTRGDIEALVSDTSEGVSARIATAYSDDKIEQLIDRLDECYPDLGDIDHVRLWKGIASFLKKPDCHWMVSFSPMSQIGTRFAELLEAQVTIDPATFGPVATKVFINLRGDDEDTLTPRWLRSHIHRLGMFGNGPQGNSRRLFLTPDQVEAQAREMSHWTRSLHLSGRLLPCRWDLMPVYTAMDTGIWDENCRAAVDELLQDGSALDSITLMMFGLHFTTGRDTISKFCDPRLYLKAVKSRLATSNLAALDESVTLALRKAASGGIAGLDGDEETTPA